MSVLEFSKLYHRVQSLLQTTDLTEEELSSCGELLRRVWGALEVAYSYSDEETKKRITQALCYDLIASPKNASWCDDNNNCEEKNSQ
jgi:hypothetical protein